MNTDANAINKQSDSSAKRVLVLYYSQTGQLTSVLRSITAPLEDSPLFDVVYENLQPVEPFPFPWPFFQFFDAFPESIYEDPRPIQPLSAQCDTEFDLIVLGYQVWFLAPSQPVTAFLQSQDASRLLQGKPVLTVIACRNMWLMAQETLKTRLAALGAKLIDNVALIDSTHSAFTFISTPMWVLTGNKGPFLNKRIPRAGVSEKDVAAARRFGERIVHTFPSRAADDYSPMLSGMSAVRINENLIPSEKIATRSFKIWGALLRKLGPPGTLARRAVLVVYVLFLVTLICTVVPLSALVKRLLKRIKRDEAASQKQHYSLPSGE